MQKTLEKEFKVWYNIMVDLYLRRPFARKRFGRPFMERKVDILSKDAISKVLAAEAEASAIRMRGEADARAMVEACEKACAEEQTAALDKTSDELDARLDMVRERAVTLIMRSREEADADIEAMQTAAREKMREAVKHIEWELTDI